MVRYGIMHGPTGNLVGFYVWPNGDDQEFCNSYACELDYEDNIWMTEDQDHATKIAFGETVPWYNSSMNNPKNTLYPKTDLKVVKLTITVEEIS